MQRIQWTAAVSNAMAVLIIVGSWAVSSADDHLHFVQREAILFFPLLAIAVSLLEISPLNRVRAYIIIGAVMVSMIGLFQVWVMGHAVGALGLWIGGYQEYEKTKSEEQKLAEKWDREFGGPTTW